MLDQNEISVICSTYNHAPYVKDALEGFCIQKTDFPYVCIIVDDASSDGTAELVNEFFRRNFSVVEIPDCIQMETPDYVLMVGRNNKNENCFFAVFFLKYNHYNKKDKCSYYRIFLEQSKYIAYCEGDDYWTDELKLQKQYDVLESNRNVTLVYSGFLCVDAAGKSFQRPDRERLMEISKSGDVFFELLKSNFIMTLTTCYRKEVVLSPYISDAPCDQDYLYSLLASALGMVVYLPEKTACYRFSPNGAMNTRARIVWEKNQIIRNYISTLYISGKLPKRLGLTHVKILLRLLEKKRRFIWYLAKQRIKKIIR